MTIEQKSRSSRTDVLVIGAGPSGLMVAQALARLNINIKIVDCRDYGTQYGNADGLQPRTLEIWQSYGMLEKFSPKAAAMHAMVCYERGENGKGLIRSTPSRNVVVNSRYPFELTASIDTIEETLRNSMAEMGEHVVQPVFPLSMDFLSKENNCMDEMSHPVKVVLKHLPPGQGFPLAQKLPDTKDHSGGETSLPETEIVFAKYVIGADGAHSWVRRQLNIPMEGDQTEYIWGVADVVVETDFPDSRFKCVIQSSTGAIIIIPREEGKIRIYVQLSAQDNIRTSNGRLDKSAFSPEVVRAKVLERAKEGLEPYKLEFLEVFWSTIFSVPQKVATHYSFRDRIFIVGDACHTHSPKAGQGANASMGDSHNLAWKLSHVLKGWAGKSLLDTYEIERRKYAQDLIEFDGRISKSLVGGTAADYQGMLHEQNLFTSGIGIRYQSRLTDLSENKFALHLKAGERLPPIPLIRLGDWQPVELQDLAPSDGLFKILVLPGDILLSSQNARLASFATTFGQAFYLEWTRRLSSFVIASSAKERVHWKEVPALFQSWKRVFVSDEVGDDGLYHNFGIVSEGAVILVRPDGYISIIAELSGTGATRIVAFLQDL